MKQTLREYLPAFFGEIRELCVLLDCFESELLLLEQTLTQQIANQFLYGGSMDEAGVNRWLQALRLALRQSRQRLYEEEMRSGRMYLSLGVCLGAAAAILLV